MLKGEKYLPIVVGHHPAKLKRLADLGLATSAEESTSDRFDVVIDCTGHGTGLSRAIAMVKPRGTIILKSTAAQGAEINLAPVVVNEITLVGSRCGRFAPALHALASKKIDPRPLIDGWFALKDGLAAFATAANPVNFKILLKPS
jgi:threonine dehydrogenase-like Zn-dependent dehydrogenase